MTRADLLRFARRDWNAVARMKVAHWTEVRRTYGAAEAMKVADRLRREVQEKHPEWPSPADRERDYDMHVRVSAALRSVASIRRP